MAEEKKEELKEEAGCGCEKNKCVCGSKRCGGGCKGVIGFLLGILLTLGAVALYSMGRCSGKGHVCPMPMSAPATK